MEAYAGIDWDRKKAIVAVLDPDGRSRALKKPIPHTLKAVNAFLAQLKHANPEATSCRVAIEAGNQRWVRLFHAAGALVHVIDSKQAKRFGESMCSSGAKADARDAKVLLDMVQSPKHRRDPWEPVSDDQAVLLQLTGTHQRLLKTSNRLVNQLRAHLSEHLPTLDACLTHFSSRWIALLLKAAPTGWHAQALSAEDFESLVAGTGMHQKTRVRVWSALQASDVLVEGIEAECLQWSVGLLVDELVLVQKQLSEVTERLETQLASDPRHVVLQSVDGVGLQLSASLLSLCFVGTPSHRDAASIRLGSSPVSRHSGQQKRPLVHLRRSASARGRRVSYLLGMQAMRNLSWARAMYAHARRHNQSAGTAFRRISRSLLRIVTAMLREGVPYDDARYIRALKDHGVPWAKDLKIPSPAG